MTKPNYSAEELEKAHSLIKRYAIERIVMMLPDLNGVLRGKWLPAQSINTVYQQGTRLAGSVFALDFWGAEIPKSGMVSENGDPDALCLPVTDALQVCDWQQTPTAQLLVSMYTIEGEPFFADPGHMLERLCRRLKKHGLTPVVAMEVEFHLFEKDKTSATDGRVHHAEVYSLAQLEQHKVLFGEIEQSCKLQGIPCDTIITEAGAQQFEINLHHVANARLACEHTLLLKRVIKSIAEKHNMTACFMAKPIADDEGNGLHANISLINKQGENLFCAESPYGSDLLQAAVAGLLETMAQSTLLFAPHANSYRRYQPDAQAPTAICWGVDNRYAALRLPKNAGDSMRIEHRVAGADANPFLVVSAILTGILHGIENNLKAPPPEVALPDPDAYAHVPHHWDDAIEAFKEASILPAYLGRAFCDLFIHCKEQEIATINSQIPDIEYQRYLQQS